MIFPSMAKQLHIPAGKLIRALWVEESYTGVGKQQADAHLAGKSGKALKNSNASETPTHPI